MISAKVVSLYFMGKLKGAPIVQGEKRLLSLLIYKGKKLVHMFEDCSLLVSLI
jgi:hypothetical protein